ncbi:uroporphyrinogen-III C-methyltransferase [Saccharicrinis aurantiacus]|uniref:uroporphyrinogen-III C-methyltransferase n=1 Tax=Saccharicrinis aurantiacus TaxID=1849719 RepID=UPI00248FEEFB|nr:uroporphyrinogen-III C-methyltransferase [Saccharicrinis aurantiacus]
MSFLPISVNISNKKIVIVGGGNSASKKLRSLLKHTQEITVVAPKISDEIKVLPLNFIEEEYNSEHIKDAFLIYACADVVAVNEQVQKDADEMGKLCNRTDAPEVSGFHSPAILATEEYNIAVTSKVKKCRKSIALKNKIDVLFDIFEKQKADFPAGKVWLVGFGPGNPELMTVKAQKLLFEAEVIVYDDLLDKSILDKYMATKEYVGKRRDNHHKTQDEINDILVKYAQEGKKVVRLKGGDPLIFGRGTEEKQYLEKHGLSVEIVPGITSAIAAAALTATPLTHRGLASSVALGTAHTKNSFKILSADTSVYYMGARNIKEIAQKYIDEGYSTDFPVAVVYNVSLPGQEVTKTNLGNIIAEKHQFKSPIVSIFGKTAGL